MTTGLTRRGGAPFDGAVEVAYTSQLTQGHRAQVKGRRTFAGRMQRPGHDLVLVSESLCRRLDCGR